MKKLITLALMAINTCLWAADVGPSGRVDTRVLRGMTLNVQDEFTSLMVPVVVLNSLAYTITNKSDGIILVRTNATVYVRIGLPNPTNNPGRRIEVHTLGASTATLTNVAHVGTITAMSDMATAGFYDIASNKTAVVYSTGTNWIARTY